MASSESGLKTASFPGGWFGACRGPRAGGKYSGSGFRLSPRTAAAWTRRDTLDYDREPPPITARLLSALLDFVFPPRCLGCEREERPGPLRLGLCLACRGRLEPLRRPACAGCARPLPAAALPTGYLCGACRRRPPAYDRLLAPWAYRPPLVEVIRALKFGRLGFLGAHLATEIWHRHGGELRAIEVVVPVPLHWRRRLGRGYNQADEIARPLARRLGRPRLEALGRTRATPAQTSLDRQRRLRNLRGVFRLRRRRRAAIAGRRVLLVDDVITTGATLHHAAATLRRAGARSVTALVAARTPLATDA